MALLHIFQHLFRPDPPSDSTEILFFGLSNRGIRYARTRHNTGFRVVDALARRFQKSRKGYFAEAEYVQGTLFETNKMVLAVKPSTFMNCSGNAVKSYLSVCGCQLSNMMVVVDDYNLPLGKIRARRNGSDGGHNGLKSITGVLESEDFPRLRVGIGPPPDSENTAGFVLGRFTAAEEKELEKVVPRAVSACLMFAERGIDAVMNEFN